MGVYRRISAYSNYATRLVGVFIGRMECISLAEKQEG